MKATNKNEMNKINSQNLITDHLISARRPVLIIINKKRDLAKLSTLLSRLTTK